MYRYHPYYSHHRDGDHFGVTRVPRWVDTIDNTSARICELTNHRWCSSGLWMKIQNWVDSKSTTFQIPSNCKNEYYDFMGWDKWWDDEGEEDY